MGIITCILLRKQILVCMHLFKNGNMVFYHQLCVFWCCCLFSMHWVLCRKKQRILGGKDLLRRLIQAHILRLLLMVRLLKRNQSDECWKKNLGLNFGLSCISKSTFSCGDKIKGILVLCRLVWLAGDQKHRFREMMWWDIIIHEENVKTLCCPSIVMAEDHQEPIEETTIIYWSSNQINTN